MPHYMGYSNFPPATDTSPAHLLPTDDGDPTSIHACAGEDFDRAEWTISRDYGGRVDMSDEIECLVCETCVTTAYQNAVAMTTVA